MFTGVEGRRRGEELVQAIFDAAISELGQYGYVGFSMERVAERAGAGKASLYRRWHSKMDLVVDALNDRLPSFDSPPDSGSLREDLLTVLRAIATMMSGPTGEAARACVWSPEVDPAVTAELKDRLIPQRKAVMLDLLRRGVERGEVRPGALESTRIAELGPKLLHGEMLIHGGPVDDETVVGIVDEILLPLLRP